MTQQIIATPSTKKVSEIFKRVKEGSLILQPEFQRRFVWNNRHKESFIDTILSGYPTPEIYIAQGGIDIDKIETVEVVVDGQQRLNTIMEYIEEGIDLKVYGNKVKKFKDLDDTEKRNFLNYFLIIRDLGDITADQIKEVFKRINSTQYSLNAVELHNAIYDGAFITTAKEILDHTSVAELPFFSESQISRMDDLFYILLIMSTIEEDGYFAGDRFVEKMIAFYNEVYPNSETVKNNIIKLFNYIKGFTLNPDSIWLKRSCYFSLFIELYKIIDSLNDTMQTETGKKLRELEEEILKNRFSDVNANSYAKFYSYVFTGTNSRKARVERGNFLKQEVLDELVN